MPSERPLHRFGRSLLRCICFIPMLIVRLSIRFCLRIFKVLHNCFGSDRPIGDPYENPAQVSIFMCFVGFFGTWLMVMFLIDNAGGCGDLDIVPNDWCWHYRDYSLAWVIIRSILLVIMWIILGYLIPFGVILGMLFSLALGKHTVIRFTKLVEDIVKEKNERGWQQQEVQQLPGAGQRVTSPLIQVEGNAGHLQTGEDGYESVGSLV